MSFKPTEDILNYTDLAKAFVDKPDEFSKMLKMIYENFITNHMLMIDSVKENNITSFRRIHHDMRANIVLFNIAYLSDLMEKIDALLSSKSTIDLSTTEEVKNCFNLIFQSLENKIKELSI